MISFTAYANKKFDVLMRHGCAISREDVCDAIGSAGSAPVTEKSLFFAQKNGVRVAFRKETGVIRVITFYPLKSDE